MIKDRPFSLAPTFLSPANGLNHVASCPCTPQTGAGNAAVPSGDSAVLSSETGEPDGTGAISPLLQGLQSWGAPQQEAGNSPLEAAQGAAGSAAPGQSQPPSQVPVSILRQVLNTLKTAGGMATAGALQSLLGWGTSELENSGKLRPEFRDILREAIDFAKETRIMSPEVLAQYESRLLSGQEGGAKGKEGADPGQPGGCPCHKGKRSLADSLEASRAA